MKKTKIASHTASQTSSRPMDDDECRTPACYEARAAHSVNEPGMDHPPKLLGSQEIYKGRVFNVRVDTVLDQGTERKLGIVEHPGSVVIAAVTAGERLVLIRQYRHAAGRLLWEIPAGTSEPDEDRLAGAQRELREETGYTADSWEFACSAYPTPGYCSEIMHLYVARDLHAGEQQLEEDERIEVREVTLQEAGSMQASGEIADMKTILALLWLTGRRYK